MKRRWIAIIILFIGLFTISCFTIYVIGNHSESEKKSIILLKSIEDRDAKSFRALVKDELNIMRYFSSSFGVRGKNYAIELEKENIPENLRFPVFGEAEIDLTLTLNNLEICEKEIYATELDGYISMNIDSVSAYAEEIAQILGQGVSIDNKPTIIKRKNGFILVCADVDNIQDNTALFIYGLVAVFVQIDGTDYLYAIIDYRP